MMLKLMAVSVLVLGLLVAGCEYHSEEAMEKGGHCLYRGAQSLDLAIKERLRDPSGVRGSPKHDADQLQVHAGDRAR